MALILVLVNSETSIATVNSYTELLSLVVKPRQFGEVADIC